MAQRGTQLLGEALELARRDRQPIAAQDHPLQRRRRRLGETHERQPPALGSGNPVVGVAAALGAHHAVSAGAQEQQRLQAVRVLAIDPQNRAHKRSPIARLRDVDQQLAVLVAAHLAEPGVRVDELQADAVGLLQQRPQLHAVAAAEIERLVGVITVAVVCPSLARVVDGIAARGSAPGDRRGTRRS